MKLAPLKKDLMEFVKENPLSFFIDIAHGEFSEESEEHHSEDHMIQEGNEEEYKNGSPPHLQINQDINMEVLAPRIRLEVPPIEPPMNRFPVLPSNLTTLQKALLGTDEHVKEIIGDLLQIINDGQYDIENNVYHWNKLCNTAMQLQYILRRTMEVYQDMFRCGSRSTIFAQYPFMYDPRPL